MTLSLPTTPLSVSEKISTQISVPKDAVQIVARRTALRTYTAEQRISLVSKCVKDIAEIYGVSSIAPQALFETERMILESFLAYDPEEIKLAFRLCVAGKIKMEGKNVDVKFFDEVFSPFVFGKVLNGYFEYRKEIIRALDKEKQRIAQQAKDNYKLSAEYQAQVDKAIWASIEDYSEREDLKIEAVPKYFYDWLIEKEEIAPTKDERNAAFNLAKSFTESHEAKQREKNAKLIMEWRNLSDLKKAEVLRLKAVTLGKKLIVLEFLLALKNKAEVA